MGHLAHEGEPHHHRGAPLRVTHLVKGLGPGGAERLVLNQLQTSAGGVEYSVLRLIPEKDHLVADIEQTGAATALVPGGRLWPLRLRSALAELRPDIVHAHSPVMAAAVRTLVRTGAVTAKVVTTEHNRWPRHHQFTRLANRLTAPFDDARIAVSQDVLETMDQRLHSSTTVLDHGVPIASLAAMASERARYRAELGVDEQNIVVGIVANFRPEKAYEVFLDAAQSALRDQPNLRFVVVGQGPGEADFRFRVRSLELEKTVSVLGYRKDATAVMSAFDIFTLTSRHEGKPVSIMEALAMRLPIVATRAGGIPEAVDHERNGILCSIGDAQALASAYVRLARDQALRNSMAVASGESASRFDASRSTRSIESRYQGISGSVG